MARRATTDRPGPPPTESCLLVPVPEAEPAVGTLRGRLDSAAALGVPAHVTILYPFVAPAAVTSDVIDTAAAAVASVRAFDGLLPGPAGSGRTSSGWRPSLTSRSAS